jgi:hypothetical protein
VIEPFVWFPIPGLQTQPIEHIGFFFGTSRTNEDRRSAAVAPDIDIEKQRLGATLASVLGDHMNRLFAFCSTQSTTSCATRGNLASRRRIIPSEG